MDLASTVHGMPEGTTYKSLIQNGTLANACTFTGGSTESTPVVPRLSPLRLRFWAEKHVDSLKGQEKALATVLLHMTESEDHWDWTAMERFHVCWEAMVSILRPGEQISLSELYRGARFSNTALGRIKVKFPDRYDVPLFNQTFPPSDQSSHVIHFGRTNSG